ncbi:MAG: YicC family protein [Clostridia bacterium]|nr:YicC family protein [Clostridia bacterium]
MRSMTGCGISRVQEDGWEVGIEVKTVNHRFLDFGLRLPRNLAFLEQPVRELVSSSVHRGHVDVFITVKSLSDSGMEVSVNADIARSYLEAARKIARETGVQEDLSVSRLLALEGVTSLSEKEMDQEKVTALCREALEVALAQTVSMREEEGLHLQQDLSEHLDRAAELRKCILSRAPLVVNEYREKLENRLKTLLQDNTVEPQRLAQEVAIMADRCAIDEELARLESHIKQMRQYLQGKGEIGKKMDFLVQEMNRETNTIGSKASDVAITQWVVELKSEIEKLREQIQNVE